MPKVEQFRYKTLLVAFVYFQYRIIAVTAALFAIFPQAYLSAHPNQEYSRSQVKMIWILVSFTSILGWTLQMISIYFAMTYRSYLPQSRKRKAISGAAPKKKLEEGAMISNVAELQLKPAPEKKLKPLSEGELQPVSENKDVQPVPNDEPQKLLSAKHQQPVSAPFANDKTNHQAK